MAEIEFKDVTKRYGDGYEAVKHLSLDVPDGELMILVGPSARRPVGVREVDRAADGGRARGDHRRGATDRR
jgi:hypothetical protein